MISRATILLLLPNELPVSTYFCFFPMTFGGYGLHSQFPSVHSQTYESSNLSMFGKSTQLLHASLEMTIILLHPVLVNMAFSPASEKEKHLPCLYKSRDYRTTVIS